MYYYIINFFALEIYGGGELFYRKAPLVMEWMKRERMDPNRKNSV